MSQTQTIVNGNNEEVRAENNKVTESRRGSQALQSPIKSIFSKAQSLTQRSQKSNESSAHEKNKTNGNKPNIAPDETNGTALRMVTDGIHNSGTENVEAIETSNEVHRSKEQAGGIDIKVQQLQHSSPSKSTKGPRQPQNPFNYIDDTLQQQILLQDNDRTISVRIEGKYLSIILENELKHFTFFDIRITSQIQITAGNRVNLPSNQAIHI